MSLRSGDNELPFTDSCKRENIRKWHVLFHDQFKGSGMNIRITPLQGLITTRL